MFFTTNGGGTGRNQQKTLSNSGMEPAQEADATCISLVELPSPIVSAPQEIDPAQIAQVALQFLGMNANDAASFTQTVDWTSTLVLPVIRGKSTVRAGACQRK